MLKTSTDPIKVEEFFRIEENHFVLACAVFSAYVKDMLPKFQKFSANCTITGAHKPLLCTYNHEESELTQLQCQNENKSY